MNEQAPHHGPHPTGPRLAGTDPDRFRPPAGGPIHTIDLVLVLGTTASLYLLVGAMIDDPARTVGFVMAMLAVQSAIPMAAVYVVVIRLRGLGWADLGFRPPASSRWYVWSALIAIGVLPAVALINLAVQAIVGAQFRNPQIDMLAPEGFSWAGLAAMLAMVGVVAPIVEEVVFRGLLYAWLRERFGIWPGAILSALAFAGAHGIVILLPALFLIGLLLARIYERSGSLWPPIIVHCVFNAMMTILLYAALAAGLPIA